MKKKGLIIASLLVLVMSVVFLGCPPPDDDGSENPPVTTYRPAISSVAQTALSKVWTGTLKVPADTNFDSFHASTDETFVAIWWKDADADKYAAYEALWEPAGSSIDLSRTISYGENFKNLSNLGTGITGKIGFTTAGGTDTDDTDTYTVPANSIVFVVYK